MSGSDLEPFIEKSHYYSSIELNPDVKTQLQLISQATRELLVARAMAADKIVISRDRITDGLDYLSTSIDEVKEGLAGLNSAFEFGISEVVWQIERKKRGLRDIMRVLMFPLPLPAQERRRRAETYYEHGFIDEAEEDLILSQELNEFDFTAYISLGMIYMFRKVNLDESIYCFDNAAEYARVKSTYYASFALMYKARILMALGSLDNAKECLEEAIDLTPDLQELAYQLSIVEALLLHQERSISLIMKLLDVDIRYCLKIESEPAFNVLKAELHDVYREIIDAESIAIQRQYDVISEEVSRIAKQVAQCATLIDDSVSMVEECELNKILKRINELVDRRSLLDIYTAGMVFKNEIPPLFELLKEDARNYIDKAIEYLKKEKIKINANHLKERNKRFIYKMNRGFRSVLVYSSIYGMALIAFDSLALAVLLSAIPFVMVWYLTKANSEKVTNLIKGVDEKLNASLALKETI